MASDSAFDAAVRAAWERLRRPVPGADSTVRVRSLEHEAAKVKRRLTRAAELFADGDLDKSGYDSLREKVRQDLDAITAELDRLADVAPSPNLPELPEVLDRLGAWHEALSAVDVGPQRELLGMVIDRVVPERLGRGRYGVTIDWTPLGVALHSALTQARSGNELIA